MLSAFCGRGEDRTQYLSAYEFNVLLISRSPSPNPNCHAVVVSVIDEICRHWCRRQIVLSKNGCVFYTILSETKDPCCSFYAVWQLLCDNLMFIRRALCWHPVYLVNDQTKRRFQIGVSRHKTRQRRLDQRFFITVHNLWLDYWNSV
jgi:hypothetical protein